MTSYRQANSLLELNVAQQKTDARESEAAFPSCHDSCPAPSRLFQLSNSLILLGSVLLRMKKNVIKGLLARKGKILIIYLHVDSNLYDFSFHLWKNHF